MKIGIITFHWAANYGAVLQAYALSRYLEATYNADVEIINYCPRNLEKNLLNCFISKNISSFIVKFRDYRKSLIIEPFRRNLRQSKRFHANTELIKQCPEYDLIITGSDQIWNGSFLMHGERKITPVYFLNFGSQHAKKISVSASFGAENISQECMNIIKPLLKHFDGLSVREKTGLDILKKMGFSDAVITADPTSLLTSEDYANLCSDRYDNSNMVTHFILRKQPEENKKLIESIWNYCSEESFDIDFLSINDWLSAIKNSKLLITNSFHAVMMCLKLHTPFAVILETGTGTGMNDRFYTLLEYFGLSDRIIKCSDDVNKLGNEIDFNMVDSIMQNYKSSLDSYLERYLK